MSDSDDSVSVRSHSEDGDKPAQSLPLEDLILENPLFHILGQYFIAPDSQKNIAEVMEELAGSLKDVASELKLLRASRDARSAS